MRAIPASDHARHALELRASMLSKLSPAVRARLPHGASSAPRNLLRAACGVRRPLRAAERLLVQFATVLALNELLHHVARRAVADELAQLDAQEPGGGLSGEG